MPFNGTLRTGVLESTWQFYEVRKILSLRIALPNVEALHRVGGRAFALVALEDLLQSNAMPFLLTGQCVETRILRVQYDTHTTRTMLLRAEVSQKYCQHQVTDDIFRVVTYNTVILYPGSDEQW